MISTLFTKLVSLVAIPVLFFTGIFAPEPAPQVPSQNLGVALPSGIATFETSLAAPMTAAATTMTVTSALVRGGTTLSGYQCFTIDEGSAQAEFVCGTASSTVISGLERGLSPADGVTETTSLKFSHRRGASVKITDFPLIQRLRSQASGDGTYDSVLQYASSIGSSTVASNGQNLASVAYVNSLSFGGVAASASSSVAGFVELASGAEAASTTIFGSTGAMLALHTGISTSTSPASGNVVVVTGDDGNIDAGFIPASIGSSTIRVFASSSTWSKPAGLKHIVVELVGGGGGGGANTVNPGTNEGDGGGGGGGGGYSRELLTADELAGTSTVNIIIGAGGNPGSAGLNGGLGSTTSFGNFLSATGGSGGDTDTTNRTGGDAGCGVGGDINICGQDGNAGSPDASGTGFGGSSYLGGGGKAFVESEGSAGNLYGGGGGGGGTRVGQTTDVAGGAGAPGVVIITEYF
jgi:hypothetical protein